MQPVRTTDLRYKSTFDESEEISTDFLVGDVSLVIETLTSNMYSNPVGSSVREIFFNSYDANIEAGAKKKVEISLPTDADATISFRDFGPGISPDRILNVYTKIGNSTKRDTNDQIGSFGYGAKSPWAVADSFIVETTSTEEDGTLVERHYLAEKKNNKTGLPRLLKVLEKPGVETGTKVSWSVPRNDIYRYHEAVQKYCSFVKPKILNDSTWRWRELDVFQEEENFYILRQPTSPNIVLNNVPYPVVEKNLTDEIYKQKATNSTPGTSWYRPIDYGSNYGGSPTNESSELKSSFAYVVPKIKGNVLAVTSSRENLDYKDDIALKLLPYYKEGVKWLKDNLEKKIKESKTFWSTVDSYRFQQNQFSWVRLNTIDTTYKGVDFSHFGVQIDTDDEIKDQIITYSLSHSSQIKEYSGHGKYFSFSNYYGSNIGDPKHFIVDDCSTKKTSRARLRTFFDDNKDAKQVEVYKLNVKLVDGKSDKAIKEIYDRTIKKLFLDEGDVSVHYLSSFKPTVNRSGTKVKTTKLWERSSTGAYAYFQEKDVELDKISGYYITGGLSSNVVGDRTIDSSYEMNRIMDWVKQETGKETYKIHGRYKDKVTTLESLDGFIQKWLNDFEKEGPKPYSQYGNKQIYSFVKKNKDKITNKKFLDFLSSSTNDKKFEEKMERYRTLCSFFFRDYRDFARKCEKKLEEEQDKILKEKPLLKLLTLNNLPSDDCKNVLEYINE